MLYNHPYVADQLIRDRQERMRRINQRTRLRHHIERIRRHRHLET